MRSIATPRRSTCSLAMSVQCCSARAHLLSTSTRASRSRSSLLFMPPASLATSMPSLHGARGRNSFGSAWTSRDSRRPTPTQNERYKPATPAGHCLTSRRSPTRWSVSTRRPSRRAFGCGESSCFAIAIPRRRMRSWRGSWRSGAAPRRRGTSGVWSSGRASGTSRGRSTRRRRAPAP